VDGGEWCDGVQGLSFGELRNPGELDCHTYERKLHGYERHERDDVLLRCDGDERGRGVIAFEPGERNAPGPGAECANEPQCDAGEWSGRLDVDGGERSDGVQGLPLDELRVAGELDRHTDGRELHGYERHERDNVLLRGYGNERRRGINSIDASERKAAGARSIRADWGFDE
jgi:hypothetical protein